MKSSWISFSLWLSCLCGELLLGAASALAKPPTLDRLFPPGGQRGQTVNVTATGSFDRWPVPVWINEPGLAVAAEKEKGKLTVVVSPDATPGVRWVRFHDEEGASALRAFVVGTLPEVVESGSKDGLPVLDPPRVTVNGRLAKRGEVDVVAVRLKKGETLVASVEANRLIGSPMDAVLQVATADRFVLAQEDDDSGFDPRIAFEAPADGTFHVRLFAFPATPDSTIGFAGGEAFVYRLTLTTGGFLDYAYPLAVSRASPGRVEAHGWNIPDEARQLDVVSDGSSETARVAHPSLAGTALVRLEPHPTLVESEPNDSEHAQAFSVPTTITGRISPARDDDVFQFEAKKDQALSFRVEARALGSPLDPVLRVTDPAGKTQAEVDDTGQGDRDPELSFTPPSDGCFRLSVRDLHNQGGDRYVYRLTAAITEPDYQLALAADRFTLTPGKPLSLPVTIEPKNGFSNDVEVRVEGLPEGVTAEMAPTGAQPAQPVPAKGKSRRNSGRTNAKSVTLTLTAKEGTGPASVPIRIVGKRVETATPTNGPLAFQSTGSPPRSRKPG